MVRYYGNDDKPFNASDSFLMFIIQTFEKYRDCYQIGNYVEAHQLLKTLMDLSTFEWTEEEVQVIDEILKQSQNLLNQPDTSQIKLKIPAVSIHLSNASRLYMKALQKRQRIFYQKEYLTFDKEIEEGFS